ncbi:permease [Desulforhopalus sp. 52FAK]
MELVSLFVAFGGGLFGAAIGALGAFVMLGFLIMLGVAAQATGGDLIGISLGAAFGPHVGGFASGIAAAAYAGHKGKIDSGRDIVSALMGVNSTDVLLVGGIFGIFGYVVQYGYNIILGGWTDTVALTVVTSAIVARLIWGNGLFGKVAEGNSRYSPNEGTEWLPWQSSFSQRAVIGLGAGILSAYIAIELGAENGGVLLGFAISAVSLTLLGLGVLVPVTHHITLVGAVAAITSGSVIWGGIFGVVAGVIAEYISNTFNTHGDTHIDPPAMTIVALTTVVIVFGKIGIFGIALPF